MDNSNLIEKKYSSPQNNSQAKIVFKVGSRQADVSNSTFEEFQDNHLESNPAKPTKDFSKELMDNINQVFGIRSKVKLSNKTKVEIKPRETWQDRDKDKVQESYRVSKVSQTDLDQTLRFNGGTRTKKDKSMTIRQDAEDLIARISKSPEPYGYGSEYAKREESTRPPMIVQGIKWTSSAWPRVEEEIRVDKLLGQGSFAKVYQGFDLTFKKIVAIKILDKRKIAELGFQKMVEKEVEIVQIVQHANICRFERMLEDQKRVVSFNKDIFSDGAVRCYDIKLVLLI